MITKKDCFDQLRDVIDAVLSTVDENGNPQSRIIDGMQWQFSLIPQDLTFL